MTFLVIQHLACRKLL